ncbi:MAG: prepilin-type N-terminal cleavage/methylation domain-containing protein [Pirellulales bacterium]
MELLHTTNVRPQARRRSGLTLLELVVVVTIVALLAGLSLAVVGSLLEDSREQITMTTMRQLQMLLVNRYAPDMAGLAPAAAPLLVRRGLPGPFPGLLEPATRSSAPQLAFLFVNPTTNDAQATFDPIVHRGWRGPYLTPSAACYPGWNEDGQAHLRGFTAEFGIAESAPGVGDGDPAVLDGWGNPIVIQGAALVDAQLVSAGPDGDLATSSDNVVLRLPLP